jgi:hypothetical protein
MFKPEWCFYCIDKSFGFDTMLVGVCSLNVMAANHIVHAGNSSRTSLKGKLLQLPRRIAKASMIRKCGSMPKLSAYLREVCHTALPERSRATAGSQLEDVCCGTGRVGSVFMKISRICLYEGSTRRGGMGAHPTPSLSPCACAWAFSFALS